MNQKIIRTVSFVLLLLMTMLFGCGRKAETLSDEQALAAVKQYCYTQNPALEGIENAKEYPVYWEIASGDDSEVVVLFHSYTGSENRYYIDRTTGDTYVTEFVSGITPEEQRTDESFNAREYIPAK